MGRRNQNSQTPLPAKINEARQEVRRALGSYDVAEFTAQLHAVSAVETLAQFMNDPTLNPEFRRCCANDLLDRAYGKPVAKQQISLFSAPPENTGPDPIHIEIEAACVKADQFSELQRYISGAVPFDKWPEHIKDMLGDSGGAVYAEITNDKKE